VKHPEVIACFRRGLEAHNRECEGASSRIVVRAMLMAEPPSIDAMNSPTRATSTKRAGLERREALVARLYADRLDQDVIVLR